MVGPVHTSLSAAVTESNYGDGRKEENQVVLAPLLLFNLEKLLERGDKMRYLWSKQATGPGPPARRQWLFSVVADREKVVNLWRRAMGVRIGRRNGVAHCSW